MLEAIAHDLVDTVRESASIDWNREESVKAAMRARVRRLLAKYDYPDKEAQAIEPVLEQAERHGDCMNCRARGHALLSCWAVSHPGHMVGSASSCGRVEAFP